MKRTPLVVGLLALAAMFVTIAPASAHPLGNFTINHLVKVEVSGRTLHVHYVLDMAEIPTFQVMRSLDSQGRPSASALQSWAREQAAQTAAALDIEADGSRLALAPGAVTVATRLGAGGLPTLYATANYSATLPTGAAHIGVRDDSFPGRIGWKDVVVAPATEPTNELRRYPSTLLASPRDVTSVQLAATPAGWRVASSVPALRAPASAPSQVRSNVLSDMIARGTGNPLAVILTLLAAIGLGALHAAEPGHGKTLLAVSLVGARATPKQALLLAIGLTAAHTAGVLVLGVLLLVAARWIVPEAIYPWITLVSGAIVAMLGAASLARFIRARRGASHDHGHAHDHDDAHDHGIRGDAPLSFRGVMLVAMSGNIAPCPAALVVLLAALALHEVGYGLAVVVAFSVGLAAVLTGLGIALVRGAAWIAKRPSFDRLAAYAPLASAFVISGIGCVMLGQGAAAGAIGASPLAVSALAAVAIAAFALAPGHTHARAHAHSHAYDQGALP